MSHALSIISINILIPGTVLCTRVIKVQSNTSTTGGLRPRDLSWFPQPGGLDANGLFSEHAAAEASADR